MHVASRAIILSKEQIRKDSGQAVLQLCCSHATHSGLLDLAGYHMYFKKSVFKHVVSSFLKVFGKVHVYVHCRTPITANLANSEDPDEMSHNAAFHQSSLFAKTEKV